MVVLSNSLAAVTTIATAATLTNPIAMTCAAVGAIYVTQETLNNPEKLGKSLFIFVE